MTDDCICKQHSGFEQHRDDITVKVAAACVNVTSAHKRVDQLEKEKVGMGTFKWTAGILITILIFVIGLNASVLGKMNDKLDKVGTAVTTIEARTAIIK